MSRFLSRMPVTRQFMFLAALGVALTVAGLALTLKRSHDLVFDAKRTEIQHQTEAGAAIVKHFIDLEKSGTLTGEEARKRAFEALGAIRYDGTNYIFVESFDGVALVNANTSLLGKSLFDMADSSGHKFVQDQIAIAKSGQPGFVNYGWTKIGENVPKPKISYVIGLPEWKILVGTGAFADDLDAILMDGIIKILFLFVPLFAGFMGVVWLMRRSLSNLLGTLSGAMERLARGDLAAEIPARDRHDEIGQMAESLVGFRQAAIDKLELEKSAAAQRASLEGERSRAAEADKMTMEANRHVVESLGMALERLSHGDLSQTVDQAYAAEYEAIRSNFNAAVAQLREAMNGIASNTAGIRTGSNEIATAADDLAHRTERQAAALAETSATINQVATTVAETARDAGEARKIVAVAIDDAAHGGVIVSEAVALMGEIEKSAHEISQIIGVIDEIAFQTNLLALNAGVEAARAGDAGRGFAVVASEVRALAQRSAEAAKDIKGLIQASSVHVGKGVNQVAETGNALSRIQVRIADINGLVVKIAASAQNQASGLAEVNAAIGDMDKATQQNAAMVEESTAASHSLASEANILSGLVERFKLDAGDGGRRASARRVAR